MDEINDIRQLKDFKQISFSGFKKTEAKKEFVKSLKQSKLEQSCYWSVELICSGSFLDLWNEIIIFYNKNIHQGNPKLAIYINIKLKYFIQIINSGYSQDILRLRNNIEIRHIFSELIYMLCISKKRHSLVDIKMHDNDYEITGVADNFKAPNVNYANDIFLKDDPKEIFIAINELAYSLSDESKNTMDACYWIEWIMNYDVKCRQQKKICIGERRSKIDVENKYQTDIVWIIWDVIIHKMNGVNNKLIVKIINNSLDLFTLKYKSGYYNSKKRKYILFFCVSLITEHVNLHEELIGEREKEKLPQINERINSIYKQIKKNQHLPNMDYMFHNTLPKNNIEHTVKKLETMDNFGELFIPRL
jgi:hypothetical protein